jgi:hypothetical protein
VRYQFPIEKKDPETGNWKEIPHWYRRVIDDEMDTLWRPLPVTEDEPNWQDVRTIEQQVEHGFEFCPVVWLQNFPTVGEIDGEPDCPPAVYDLSWEIDMLLSGGTSSTMANCDATAVINTAAELPTIKKGSDNAIKLPGPGDSAHYMEMSGTGSTLAFAEAKELREYALEVSQCVLVSPEVAGRTATEIERQTASMLSKVNRLRSQWGAHGIKPLLQMIIDAARSLESSARTDREGNPIRLVLDLPPKMVKEGEGDSEHEVEQPVKLGKGGVIELTWPALIEPTPQDTQLVATATAAAKQAGLIDAEHAAKHVASYFGVNDVPAMLARIEEEQQKQNDQAEAQLMAGIRGATPGAPPAGKLRAV